MAEGLRTGDEGLHLITFHPRGGDDSISSSSHIFSNSDPVLDFNMRQNGRGDHTKTWSRIFSDYSLESRETRFGWGTALRRPSNQLQRCRARLFKRARYSPLPLPRFVRRGILAIPMATTRYGNSILRNEAKGLTNPSASGEKLWKAPAQTKIRHARALLESRPFLSRIPDHSLIHTFPAANAIPGSRYQVHGINARR